MQFGEQRTDKHFQNSKIHFGEKTNGQTFQKKAKRNFEKSSFKKRMDKL